MIYNISREYGGTISTITTNPATLVSQLPFKVGDTFTLIVTYTYDTTKYPGRETLLPIEINLVYNFVAKGVVVYNTPYATECFIKQSILLGYNFDFNDEIPQFTQIPGLSWFGVDQFYLNYQSPNISYVMINLLNNQGVVDGVIHSQTIVSSEMDTMLQPPLLHHVDTTR